MRIDRVNEIKKMIEQKETISISELCKFFKVSKNTIRRDINELKYHGVLEKVYGGVKLKDSNVDLSDLFPEQEIFNSTEKRCIAQIASELIDFDEIIYIDSGSSTMHLLPYIYNRRPLIITASIYVIECATRFQNLEVVATGGVVNSSTNSFVGFNVLNCIREYNFSKIFLSCAGISLEHGATVASPLEYEVKKELMKKSAEKYLLVDNSKVDKISLRTYSELKDFDSIIMDSMPPPKYLKYFDENDIRLMARKNK